MAVNLDAWGSPEEIQALLAEAQSGRLRGESGRERPANVIRQFYEAFGRIPTRDEISMALPAADIGTVQSRDFINQYKQRLDNSPEGLLKKNQDKYASGKDQWDSQIASMFQNSLGRDATAAEKQHFGSLLASGEADAYGIGSFLQALPEYRNKQDTEFRGQQRGEFEKADTQYYTDKLLPAIQAQMAQSGRSLESSGYASAMAQAAKQQAQERERYLTNLSSQQYMGRTGDARKDYESYIGQLGDNRQRNYRLTDAFTGRQNEVSDYYRKKDDYDQYLSRYGRPKRDWMDYANFGLKAIETGAKAYAAL